LKLRKKGQPLAKFGRPSFSENTVNTQYNSRYRNSENTNRLGGKLLELGRATGIVQTRMLRRSFLMIEFMSIITSRVF
jgi:hypothetical protein